MESVFLFCFAFGLLFSLASAALGAIGGHFDVGGHHLDIGGHTLDVSGVHGDPTAIVPHGMEVGAVKWLPHGHSDFHLAQYLSLTSLMAFVTWFGAAGYIALTLLFWPLLFAVPLAIGAGVAGGAIAGKMLSWLRSGETIMRAEDYRLEGTLADVTVSIAEGGTGEIVFSMMGARRSEAARSVSGTALPRGSKVVITGYERGVARVEAWQDLLDDPATEAERLARARENEVLRPRPETETDPT